MVSGRFDGLKIRVLRLLAQGQPKTALEVAAGVGVWPRRGIYRPLFLYRRWGLVERSRKPSSSRSGPRRVQVFGITDRGRARLRWLSRNRVRPASAKSS